MCATRATTSWSSGPLLAFTFNQATAASRSHRCRLILTFAKAVVGLPTKIRTECTQAGRTRTSETKIRLRLVVISVLGSPTVCESQEQPSWPFDHRRTSEAKFRLRSCRNDHVGMSDLASKWPCRISQDCGWRLNVGRKLELSRRLLPADGR